MTKKIWALTEGTYSDFEVLALALDEGIIDQMLTVDDHYEKHGYPFLEEMPKRLTELFMVVAVTADGKAGEEQSHTYPVWDFEQVVFEDTSRPPKPPTEEWPYGSSGTVQVQGTDHQRVRKVFGERKAQYQARAAGIAD